MSTKTKKNKQYASIITVLLILISILAIVSIKKLIPIYSISDRTQKVLKKSQEDDTVFAWLRVQGTNIDYPVVYSFTEKFRNEEYDYDYLWTNSNSTTLNDRVIVWGHNIRNVSSQPLINQKEFNYFENLPSFLYYDFVKDNKYILYTINKKNYLYKIYSVSMVDKNEFSNNENMNKEDKEEYIKKTIEESYFDFDVEVEPNKKIITLATCTRFGGSKDVIIKIDGVMVDENEKVLNYKVKKKKQYEKIEKTMKGDGDYDKEEA